MSRRTVGRRWDGAVLLPGVLLAGLVNPPFPGHAAAAQPVGPPVAPVTLPHSETRILRSEIVGADYKLFISLPWRYHETDVTYPVLYATDANRNSDRRASPGARSGGGARVPGRLPPRWPRAGCRDGSGPGLEARAIRDVSFINVRGCAMRTVAAMLAGPALFSPIPAPSQEAAPDPVESFLAAWNRRDVGRIGSLCAADAEYTEVATGTVYHGSAGCEEYARLTFAGASDFELETTTIVRDGNRTVAEWIMSGTQTGDWPGLRATGARFSVPGVSVIETDGALIRRVADYFDLCTLLRQLGAPPDLGGIEGMAGGAGPVPGAAQAPAEAAGLPEYVEAYRNAWNRHDATAVAAFFGEDADLVMGNLPAARGRGAIEAWWRRYFERQEPERRGTFDMTSARLLAPDIALVNVATTTGAGGAGALPVRKARGTWLLRRHEGEWLISAMRGLPTEEDRVELVRSLETAEALRPQIRAFVAAYEETFNRHDPEALSAFYREDADIIIREGPVIHGARAIRAWWRAYFSQPRPYRALLIIEEIRMMADDVALLNVVGTGATLDATDEPVPVRQARATWVLVREDGEWRIAALRVLPSEDDRVIRASAR